MKFPQRKNSNLSYTYTTKSFTAEVISDPNTGKNRIKILHDYWYQTEINKFRKGEKVSVSITNAKPKRTEQQNRYYWGVYLPEISRETGEKDIERLHLLFSGQFLTEAIFEVLGRKVRKKKSTSELSTGEFSNYIVDIYTETGVMPPPTENWGLQSLNDTFTKRGYDYPTNNLQPTI